MKNDWEDAKENLELFESSVGDGYFYASNSGTILRTMIRKGQELTSDSILFMYSNPEEMTVTVSVDQADIAKIALGDSAYVQSTEYGTFEGTVTKLNPVSTSSSRTSVTYDVTVTLTGDTSAIPANTSVTVIFGMEEGMLDGEGMTSPNGEKPTDGEMPQMNGEGMTPPDGEMPTDGEIPQFDGEMSTDGEKPQFDGEMTPPDGEMPGGQEKGQRPDKDNSQQSAGEEQAE